MLVVCTLYLHDARLEYVAGPNPKSNASTKAAIEENNLDDAVLMSTGRHIHIESMSLPGTLANYGTSLASSQPRNRENEDKYIAQNKLVCNTYGNSSK
jgi:hypothetical protein